MPHEELERLFLEFLRKRAFPLPLINRWLQVGTVWIKPDCMWPHARLIAELDGRVTHDTTRAFESDRVRHRRLTVAGWRVIHVTWRQLTREPDELEADLRALLTC